MKKLRIMWLFSHLSYSGGGTRYVFEAIRELSKNHKVDLYVQKTSPKFIAQFKEAGINLVVMSNRSTGDVGFWFNFWKQINKEILFLQKRTQDYDLVVSAMFPMNIEANSLGLPHLQSCFQPFAFFWDQHMISKLSFWERIFIKIIKFRFGKSDIEATRKSDKISTVIADVQPWIQKVYGRESFVAHAGVDTNFFKKTENPQLQKKYAGKKVILHSTDWTPLKRTNWLIDQFVDISSEIKDVFLIIMEVKTKGLEKDLALKKIKEKNLSNVELCGFIPEELLPAYYSVANVSVYCGVGEGASAASYIVLESLACETPVVRTDFTHDEVEHGKTGYLFDKDDADNFKKYVTDLLSDKLLASKFGHAGREFIIENRSWKKFAEIWEKNFSEILKN